MASLVSQDQALRQLRLVEAALTADQLADVMDKAEQASFIVVDYLKRDFVDGPLTVNPYRRREAARRAPPAPGQRWDDGSGDQPWGGSGDYPWMGWGDQPWTPPPPPLPGGPTPWTQTTCPSLVKAAILIVLTSLYDGRTPDDSILSPSVVGILARFRDPACA